jgi:hypothetical protein
VFVKAIPDAVEKTNLSPESVINAVKNNGQGITNLVSIMLSDMVNYAPKLGPPNPKSNEYAKPLWKEGKMVIDGVDGSQTFANMDHMDKLFASVSPRFFFDPPHVGTLEDPELGANEPGKPTGERPVIVCEQVKAGTIEQILRSINPNLDELCFTQHQIINFAKKYRHKLRPHPGFTYFLFKSHNRFLIANLEQSDENDLKIIADLIVPFSEESLSYVEELGQAPLHIVCPY